MASKLRELIVRISADSSQYQREMSRASRMGSDYYKSIEGGARRADAAMRRNQQQLEAVRTSLGAARQQAIAFFAAYAGIEGARGIVRQADAWKNTSARIKLATQDQREFTQAQTGLLELSNQTRTSFEANANLFARSAQSVRDYGGSVEDALGLTESIALGLRLSGATAEESSSVITQLSQALSSGVLRGEEFNAINESGNRAAQALADGLGVARGELRAMAEAGQLTTGRVLKAMTSQLVTLRKEAATLPDTVGASLQVLNNQWTAYVGRQDAATGATQVMSTAILGLANNLDTVANAGVALAGGVLAGYFTKLSRSVGTATLEVVQGTRAQISHAAAQREAAAQLVRRTAAEQASAKAALATAQAQYNAARGTNAQAFATQALSGARDRYAVATSEAAAATTALSAANSRLNTVMAVTRRVGSGVLGLLGGPAGLVGIVASVAAGWLLYRDNTQKASSANIDMSATLDDLRTKFRALNDDQQRAELVAWGQKQREEIEKAQQGYEQLRESITSTFGGQFGQRVAQEFDQARQSGESLSAVVARIQERYGLSDEQTESWLVLAGNIADADQAAQKAEQRQNALSGALVKVSDTAIRASRSLAGLNDTANEGPSQKVLDKWRTFNERLRDQMAAIRDPSEVGAASRELDSLGIDDSVLRGFTIFQASQLDAIRQQQEARKAAAAEAKRITAEAIRNAQREAEEVKRALEQEKNQYVSLLDTLYPVQAAQKEYARDKELLVAWMMREGKTADELAEAQRRLKDSYASDEDFQKVYGFDPKDTKKLEQTTSVAKSLGLTFSSAFEDAVIGGNKFRDVLSGIADDIQRILIRKSVTEPAANALGSFDWGSLFSSSSSGSYSSGWAASATSFSGGGYTGAGGKYTPKGVVHAEEFVVRSEVVKQPGVLEFLTGLNRGYANGGYVGSSVPAMPAVAPATAGDMSIVIHNEGEPAQVTRTEQRRSTGGKREIHMWLKSAFSSGALDTTMADNFGIQRRGRGNGNLA
ncbi:tape measure protein [Salinicola corii]|uniref:Tape measure protein n=1 Tax=Salinicola corii TaxID=2606937 RepID=A0A640WCU6_9GAMM|nr:tape measure protein [Salinicola corii]KAA0017105.1 tape measure protein [Salinicola corii]